jgi:hypothetical protein
MPRASLSRLASFAFCGRLLSIKFSEYSACLLAIAPIVLRRRKGEGASADFHDLKSLLGEINRLAGERNKYVHDTWGAQSENSSRVFQFRMRGNELHGRYQRVNRRAVVRLIGKIETQRRALLRFSFRVGPKMAMLHEKLGRPPALLLEPAAEDVRVNGRRGQRLRVPQSS